MFRSRMSRKCFSKPFKREKESQAVAMKYRILITKTHDVPNNMFNGVYDTEGEARKAAQEKLAELNGDVAVVMELREGVTRVIQRYVTVRR